VGYSKFVVQLMRGTAEYFQVTFYIMYMYLCMSMLYVESSSWSEHTHTHTHTYVRMYVCMYVCVFFSTLNPVRYPIMPDEYFLFFYFYFYF
jgi:hypothetical protein